MTIMVQLLRYFFVFRTQVAMRFLQRSKFLHRLFKRRPLSGFLPSMVLRDDSGEFAVVAAGDTGLCASSSDEIGESVGSLRAVLEGRRYRVLDEELSKSELSMATRGITSRRSQEIQKFRKRRLDPLATM